MTPSGRSLAKSSASVAHSGTPACCATSAALGATSTMADSRAPRLFRISSMWRRPMRPAPATAMRTLGMDVWGSMGEQGPGAALAAPERTLRSLLAAHLVNLGEDLLRKIRPDVGAVLVDDGLELRADLGELGRWQLRVLHRFPQIRERDVLRVTRHLALVRLRFLCCGEQNVLLVLVQAVPGLLADRHRL